MKMIKRLVLVGGLLLAGTASANECYDHYSNQRYAEALTTCTVMAEKGGVSGQYNLGVMYDNGNGVTQDYKRAAELFTKAAEQGHIYAQFNLGNLYADGRGVPQDYKKSVKWLQMAAEQGFAEAQYNLGNMYLQGRGVQQDMVAAYVWWNVAAAQGQEAARGNRDLAVKKMTLSQLKKGQELSREYFKKYTNLQLSGLLFQPKYRLIARLNLRLIIS
ncbi:MAG: tetratricopeptide repeat protein [Porticoccus sp.]|nr:tetratricopeptide repeat protein [Porticoccus sp.]